MYCSINNFRIAIRLPLKRIEIACSSSFHCSLDSLCTWGCTPADTYSTLASSLSLVDLEISTIGHEGPPRKSGGCFLSSLSRGSLNSDL